MAPNKFFHPKKFFKTFNLSLWSVQQKIQQRIHLWRGVVIKKYLKMLLKQVRHCKPACFRFVWRNRRIFPRKTFWTVKTNILTVIRCCLNAFFTYDYVLIALQKNFQEYLQIISVVLCFRAVIYENLYGFEIPRDITIFNAACITCLLHWKLL